MTTIDMIRVVAAGGGLRVDCKGKTIMDLIRIAAVAKQNNSGFLVLTNTQNMSTMDMIKISAAGKGHVLFDDVH